MAVLIRRIVPYKTALARNVPLPLVNADREIQAPLLMKAAVATSDGRAVYPAKMSPAIVITAIVRYAHRRSVEDVSLDPRTAMIRVAVVAHRVGPVVMADGQTIVRSVTLLALFVMPARFICVVQGRKSQVAILLVIAAAAPHGHVRMEVIRKCAVGQAQLVAAINKLAAQGHAFARQPVLKYLMVIPAVTVNVRLS